METRKEDREKIWKKKINKGLYDMIHGNRYFLDSI
jgi:hypothetical protein